MYANKEYRKDNIVKTGLDYDDYEAMKEVIALSPKCDISKFVRRAILDAVDNFHANNSIGRFVKQPDLFKSQNRA